MHSIIETLEFIKTHSGCGTDNIDYHTVLDLHGLDYVDGRDVSTLAGHSFKNLRLTISGNEYLNSLKNADAEPNHATYKPIEKPNQWSSNPIHIIALIVVGGFILAAALYLFKTHIGIPLN